MKRIKLTCILFLISLSVFGQNIKKELQGNWICTRVVDSLNVDTEGKFVKSGNYLMFSFRKSSLLIRKAPFEGGMKVQYLFTRRDSIIDYMPFSRFPLAETNFKVKYISGEHLVLQEFNKMQHRSVYYLFIRQVNPVKTKLPTFIDCGTILINHLKLEIDGKIGQGVNKSSTYFIRVNPSLLYPTPTFNEYNSGGNLGGYLSNHFSLPKNYKLDSLSKEMVVEFDVAKKGAENFIIVKGIDSTFNEQILKILDRSGKDWKPVMIDNKVINTRIRLHLYFYLGVTVSPLRFDQDQHHNSKHRKSH